MDMFAQPVKRFRILMEIENITHDKEQIVSKAYRFNLQN